MGFHLVVGATRRFATTSSVLLPTMVQNILLGLTRCGNDTLIILCIRVHDCIALAALDEIHRLRWDESVASVPGARQEKKQQILAHININSLTV